MLQVKKNTSSDKQNNVWVSTIFHSVSGVFAVFAGKNKAAVGFTATLFCSEYFQNDFEGFGDKMTWWMCFPLHHLGFGGV